MSSRLETLAVDGGSAYCKCVRNARAELKATGDWHVAGLILRRERHRAAVIAALAAQSVDVPASPEARGAPSQLISQASRGRRAANS